MRVLSLLFILSIFRLSNCGGEDENGTKQGGITLDIFATDESKIEKNEGLDKGVRYSEYIPRDGFHIVSVEDNGQSIWRAEYGERFILAQSFKSKEDTLIAVIVHSGDRNVARCFKKTKGLWEGITRFEYDEILDAIMAKSEGESRECALENEKLEPEIPSYSPIDREEAVSRDYSTFIQEIAPPPPRRNRRYQIPFYHDNIGYSHFRSYMDIVPMLFASHFMRPPPLRMGVTMNILNPDWKFFEVEGKREGYGSYSGMMCPLDKYYVKRIIYGNELIWKRHDGWECTHVSIHTSKTRELLIIGFRMMRNVDCKSILRCQGGKWQDVSRLNTCDIIFDMHKETLKEMEGKRSNGLLEQFLKFVSKQGQKSDIEGVSHLELKKPYSVEELARLREGEFTSPVDKCNGKKMLQKARVISILRGRETQAERAVYRGYCQVLDSTFRLLRMLLRR
ncbi:hypothetical protein BEWA_035260 [Theileria equi strain WA]|uniref:Signal peptide-containing protein n=1 Tax=Theileria equi strain WA TaxID=1537102 RepID=L1LE14_THEEQ|nr:hypothetical protein BEWA_035260 [Theileria equi strain WA]EKX73490.1 hypothetical protein BEWA_035260 [Theileria equi strain WA]|eukprot:XP_004832942.1 hypothetical protein BEWA_035260 [Theileria equi strain WA]